LAGDAVLEERDLRADAGFLVHGRRIIERVVADESGRRGDPLRGLRRIGIDELS
jgi:hypothetical protein